MSVELLKQYMQDGGLSQAKVANILGVSASVVSQYLKGTYTGDVEAIDEKVAQMTQRAKDKAQDIKRDFVSTVTAKKIIDVCGMALPSKTARLSSLMSSLAIIGVAWQY